jgi:hypothetical protein
MSSYDHVDMPPPVYDAWVAYVKDRINANTGYDVTVTAQPCGEGYGYVVNDPEALPAITRAIDVLLDDFVNDESAQPKATELTPQDVQRIQEILDNPGEVDPTLTAEIWGLIMKTEGKSCP